MVGLGPVIQATIREDFKIVNRKRYAFPEKQTYIGSNIVVSRTKEISAV
jgi:hypothetical protein